MKGRNFPAKIKHAWTVKIYLGLIVYIKKELNILRVAIGVLDIFQLSDVYQMSG